MSETTILWVLIVSSIGTFLLRYSFLWLNDRMPFPERLGEWLKLIPATAIISLIVPALTSSPSALTVEGIPKLCAMIVATLVMWKTRNVTLMLLLGMVTFWLTRGLS
ncbi:AzlD domain-containing protein [Salmonella enterica]|nr:AzlD domain-containing protein [Salmonella enterica]EJT9668057.1 AzlD domain-containing protein [Salmonella enterica]EKO4095986.1 AzlD domain-containing protein [Salmonella enterica]